MFRRILRTMLITMQVTIGKWNPPAAAFNMDIALETAEPALAEAQPQQSADARQNESGDCE
jgi:hypothetical protein